MFSCPFPEPQRQDPGSTMIAGTSSKYFITSLQDCSRHCSWYIELGEGQVSESAMAGKSLINDIFCWKLVKKTVLFDQPTRGDRPYRPSPRSATYPVTAELSNRSSSRGRKRNPVWLGLYAVSRKKRTTLFCTLHNFYKFKHNYVM